jgi:branched-chain amino acid transport system ATP-binding protein
MSISPNAEADRHTSAAAGEVLLHADGLHKSFGGVQAVCNISLAIPAATVFAIIGPNGAGKSTLLNLLSGIYQPDAGTMTLAGVDVIGMPPQQRVRHGLARTFQKIRLFKQLSVIENVIAGFHIRHQIPAWEYVVHGAAFRRDRERCRDEAMGLLAFVGLNRRAHITAGALSYGEQRMLEIARALATAPRLLMIDEPAAGLNAAEADALLARIADLRARGITVVLVEHNMDLVMSLADRILVMDYGQHLFEGTPSDVQAHPDVIKAYLGAELQ